MRCALRFCGRRTQWTKRSFLAITSIKDRYPPVWGRRKSQTCPAGSLVSSVRFYSQGRNVEDVEEKGLLSSPLADLPLPAEIQSADSISGKRQKRSPFTDNLQRCGSPSDVLDLTCRNAPTVHQVSNCLTRMWSSTKKMSDEQRRYELQLMFEHPSFDMLLKRAMKGAGYMRSEDVAYSLLSMVKLGVPQRSRVVQTLLRTCQVHRQRLSTSKQRFFSYWKYFSIVVYPNVFCRPLTGEAE